MATRRKSAKNIFQYKTTVSVSRAALRQAAQFTSLKKNSYRVMILLMSRLESHRPVDITPKHIANELMLDKSDVKEALNELLSVGLITEKSSPTGRGYTLFDDEAFDSSDYENEEEEPWDW